LSVEVEAEIFDFIGLRKLNIIDFNRISGYTYKHRHSIVVFLLPITSVGTSKCLLSKKKFAATATNIALVSPHIQMTKY
jgi:hypothetical protein